MHRVAEIFLQPDFSFDFLLIVSFLLLDLHRKTKNALTF